MGSQEGWLPRMPLWFLMTTAPGSGSCGCCRFLSLPHTPSGDTVAEKSVLCHCNLSVLMLYVLPLSYQEMLESGQLLAGPGSAGL